MIDFATLTGAVLVALGNRASGLMGNDDKLINKIKNSAEMTGEKVWELPLWPEYSKDIQGKYADIQNLGKAGAGTITASKIAAGTITSTQIASGTITTSQLNFTPLSSSNFLFSKCFFSMSSFD